MHTNKDLVIVEPVRGSPLPGIAGPNLGQDLHHEPVQPRAAAQRNHRPCRAIRICFAATAEMTLIDGSRPCGSAYSWIEEVQGRLDDSLHYADGLTVHPIVLRSP